MTDKVVLTPPHIRTEIADLLKTLRAKIEGGAGGPWEFNYDLLTLLRRLAFIEDGGAACEPSPHLTCSCPNVRGRPLSRIKIAQPDAGFVPAKWERIVVPSDDISRRNTTVRDNLFIDFVANSLDNLLAQFEQWMEEVDIPPNNLLLFGGPSVVRGERKPGGERTKYSISFVLCFSAVDVDAPPWYVSPHETPNEG